MSDKVPAPIRLFVTEEHEYGEICTPEGQQASMYLRSKVREIVDEMSQRGYALRDVESMFAANVHNEIARAILLRRTRT